MLNFVTEYAEELLLLLGIVFFKAIGRPQTAEKLEKKRKKKIAKLEKKTAKDIAKAQRDVDTLEELKKEK